MCGANCDPGEIKNGICFECQLEQKKKAKVKAEVDRMARTDDYKQLRMEEFLNE
mgnify:CR=1 FL=1